MMLVVGATGIVGGRIAHQLLSNGADVRVLVRPGSAYQGLVEAGARAVFGDLKDPESLTPALDGIETVITTASAGSRGGEDTIERVDLQGNHDLIAAAARAGVRQFIFVSTIGSDPHSPVPMMRAKGLAESRLRACGLGYTILQANALMDVWLPLVIGVPLGQGRPVALIGEGRRTHSLVAAQDIAAFAVAAVDHSAADNQTIVIGGPAAISWREIIATVASVLGRPIDIELYAPGEQLPGLPPLVSVMMAALDTFDSPIDMTETTRRFGVTLTPVEAWVRSNLAPMLSTGAGAPAG